MEANVSVCRVTKRLRHRGKDLKAEGAPQPDSRCIGFDDRIELHRPVAVRACLFKDTAAQSPAYALTAPCRMDNKAGIGNVCPRARVDGTSVRAHDDTSIVIHGDNGAPWWLSHPPSACPRFCSRGIPCQGLARGTHLFQDQPDSGPVLCLRLTYHHLASMAQPHSSDPDRAHSSAAPGAFRGFAGARAGAVSGHDGLHRTRRPCCPVLVPFTG